MIKIGMKGQKLNSTQMVEKLSLRKQSKEMKTYHVYLNDRCLFKNLDEREFKVIWGRLYHSYWDGLTYSEMVEEPNKQYEESSY
jgi:phenylalanine-4-hydroxylase